MAKLVFSDNGLVSIVCSNKFKILDRSDGKCKFYCNLSDIKLPQDVEKLCKQVMNDNKQDTTLGHGNIASFSPSGRLYSLCTSNKILSIWKTDTWDHLGARLIDKKPTALVFTNDEEYVIVADKSGDVYKFSTKDSESKGVFVLGHISMIMDMVISKDDKYIMTAERDEKIRVSHFPNSYSIKSYCLGHSDFVSSIKLLSQEKLLVSGSGDGTIIFWDFRAGKKVHIERLDGNGNKEQSNEKSEETMESEIVSCITICRKNDTVCVMTEKSGILWLYHVDSSGQVTALPCLSTSAPPWHVTFDLEGFLWCLLPNSQEPVAIFRPEQIDTSLKYVKNESFDNIPVYYELKDWSYLEECQGRELQLSLLRKRTDIDNMKDYLNRKEERIQQKKARQQELEAKESQDNAKRVKV